MQPALQEKGFEQLKNIIGSEFYPNYTIQPEHIEQIWRIYQEIIEVHETH